MTEKDIPAAITAQPETETQNPNGVEYEEVLVTRVKIKQNPKEYVTYRMPQQEGRKAVKRYVSFDGQEGEMLGIIAQQNPDGSYVNLSADNRIMVRMDIPVKDTVNKITGRKDATTDGNIINFKREEITIIGQEKVRRPIAPKEDHAQKASV